jgi:hypothetical protein
MQKLVKISEIRGQKKTQFITEYSIFGNTKYTNKDDNSRKNSSPISGFSIKVCMALAEDLARAFSDSF